MSLHDSAEKKSQENHLETIERLTQDVEWAQVEVNVVRNLEQGNEALKSLTALLNLDDIEKMLDETKDAAETQKEISDMIIGVAPEFEVRVFCGYCRFLALRFAMEEQLSEKRAAGTAAFTAGVHFCLQTNINMNRISNSS